MIYGRMWGGPCQDRTQRGRLIINRAKWLIESENDLTWVEYR